MPLTALLLGSLSITTLAGCDRIEQAAAEAVEQARQSTAEVIDEAVRPGSLQQATQNAQEALQEAQQKAADMLGTASDYLADEAPAETGEAPAGEPATTAL